MSDLISRRVAIDGFYEMASDMDHLCTVSDYVSFLESLPSAQPKIIRCEDCMHNGSFDTDCPIDWNGKEYCSFAERRQDD